LKLVDLNKRGPGAETFDKIRVIAGKTITNYRSQVELVENLMNEELERSPSTIRVT
jgi:hypothetical protein